MYAQNSIFVAIQLYEVRQVHPIGVPLKNLLKCKGFEKSINDWHFFFHFCSRRVFSDIDRISLFLIIWCCVPKMYPSFSFSELRGSAKLLEKSMGRIGV